METGKSGQLTLTNLTGLTEHNMPRYMVTLYRTRPETAIAYVDADSPNDICVNESEVEYNEWVVDPYTTHDFEQMGIEEDR